MARRITMRGAKSGWWAVSTGLVLALCVGAAEPKTEPTKVAPGKSAEVVPVPGGVAAGFAPGNANLQKIKLPPNPKVMIIPVNDEESTRYGRIDQWQSKFISRRLEEAKRENYNLVVLEIDTFGGEIFACHKIDKAVAECGVPVIAFVKGNAFSGGALISLGCQAIVMAPGTNVGGAQAVGPDGRALPQDERAKAVSWLIADVKGLSEKYGYPEALAQGMVDMECEVIETDDPTHRFLTDTELVKWQQNEVTRGPAPRSMGVWKKKDEILTLTAQQAYDGGLASVVVPDTKTLWTTLGVTPSLVDENHITLSERIGRVLGHPIALILLVVLGVAALVFELKAGGHGLGYMAFILCLVLFFWSCFLADTAGALELILFFAGVLLLGAELFIWPGFGVTGVAGVAFVLLSIVSAFIPEGTLPSLWQAPGTGNPFQAEVLQRGLLWAAVMLLTLIGLGVGVIAAGVRLPGISRLALQADVHPLPPEAGPAAARPAPAPVATEPEGEIGRAHV
jgi:membrane-bound ClpP family serine protease